MANITSSVGDGGVNKVHDVCIIQAMLKVIKNSKGHAYLGANYDGSFGAPTKNAILAFQKDFSLVPATPAASPASPPSGGILGVIAQVIVMASTDKNGYINIFGPTLQKLNDMLPATHKDMRIIEDTKTVYLEGSSADASASKLDVTGDANFEAGFRPKLANLVEQTFARHKIVLWVTSTGHRRTFAQQAAISAGATKAGPGESNHNFGRAADLGFKDFKWVQADGTIKQDNDWLSSLEHASAAKASAFWDKRDDIALSLGLFRLAFERIHVQAFNQATVSNPNSLAKLLTTVGTMKWEAHYRSDLGLGGDLFNVGSAKEIWAGNATVTIGMLAKAKGLPAASIKPKDVTDMRAELKRQFELADTNFLKWTPEPP